MISNSSLRRKKHYGFHGMYNSGGAAVGTGGNLGIVPAGSGNSHNIVPVEIPKLRERVAVKAGVRRVIVHAAHLTRNGQNMIFGSDRL